MLRIGICDDTAGARDSLRLLCLKHFRLEEPDFFEFSGGEGAVRWLHSHPGTIDLLFLDIEMAGMDGMTAAKQIRGFDQEVMLCFVTGYADYVYDGYEVEAMGYLVKPVEPNRLSALLGRVEERLEQRQPKTYAVQSGGVLHRLPLREILYAASDRRQVTIVTRQGQYTFYSKLDTVAEELGAGFVRVHQRYLVNAAAVTSLEGERVVVGGECLPISRGLRREATMALARAMVGEEKR